MDTLSRLLPFSREVFLRLFEHYNTAIWPLQVAAYLLGLFALIAALRPFPGSGRLAALVLAAGWIWTGVGYHMLYFSRINWAAWAFGFFFVLQGLLFLSTGVLRGRLAFRFGRDPAGWCGLVFVAAAMIVYPLIGTAADQAWPRIALLGVAPCPTTLFTLGLLLMAEDRVPWHLLIIPLIWALIGGTGAILLDIPQDLSMPIAAVLTVVLAISKNRPGL